MVGDEIVMEKNDRRRNGEERNSKHNRKEKKDKARKRSESRPKKRKIDTGTKVLKPLKGGKNYLQQSDEIE
ncbi:hypothetical protein RhiirA4_460329 [Rhizophagus irregularis]|uniref:Uncharacterized protein n=1 Tax=Rhizophagus irregularis TaxID=588596 RepID=A0A2I1GGE8_9GLOM|nr:hypothetical protein RhiirA4_460329 [Rhizophagus irregularis]